MEWEGRKMNKIIGTIGALLFIIGASTNMAQYDLVPYFIMALGVICLVAWHITEVKQ
jgi:hypothetical protein